MPRVLIIRGYRGSGKSSVAKALAEKRKCAFLEYDLFLWRMNSVKKPGKGEYDITYRNFIDVLKNYLKHTRKDIIIEGPLVPRTPADPMDIRHIVKVVRRAKYECVVVQIVAEEKVCVTRMRKRKHVVPKRERDMFKKKHDESVLDDEIIVDSSEHTLKRTVNTIERLL